MGGELYVSSFVWVLFSMQVLGDIILVKPLSESITVAEGSDFDLECQHPTSETVEWFLSGMPITNMTISRTRFSFKQEVRGDKLVSRLMIEHINRTERGVYKCSNADKQKALFGVDQSDEVRVTVQIDTGGVLIIKPLSESITVPEGGNVEFECQHPLQETVEWFLSGMRIRTPEYDASRFNIERVTRGKKIITTLKIDSINRTEGGIYKCSNADLQKVYFDSDQTDSVTVNVMKIKADLRIEGPPDGTIAKGKDLTLFCTGDKTSDLFWYFKGTVIRSDEKEGILTTEVNVDKSHRRLALTRHQVTADDHGIYGCQDKVNKLTRFIDIKVVETAYGMTVHSPSTYATLLTCALTFILASLM